MQHVTYVPTGDVVLLRRKQHYLLWKTLNDDKAKKTEPNKVKDKVCGEDIDKFAVQDGGDVKDFNVNQI